VKALVLPRRAIESASSFLLVAIHPAPFSSGGKSTHHPAASSGGNPPPPVSPSPPAALWLRGYHDLIPENTVPPWQSLLSPEAINEFDSKQSSKRRSRIRPWASLPLAAPAVVPLLSVLGRPRSRQTWPSPVGREHV
jgi:hypothetical protein